MACLITGAQGQLGRELVARLPDALATDIDTLDITDAEAVAQFVREHQVDTIINCAAYTAVDLAEDDSDRALMLNGFAPQYLAKTGCKLIHISTDYVFDGTGSEPYKPEDAPSPLSVYGATKRSGEEEVLKHATTFAIIRTSWLYSAHGKNFVKTIRQLAEKRPQLFVVNDQVGSPTFAGDLADAIVAILPQLTPETSGIYHYAHAGSCSWFEFAQAITADMTQGCAVKPVSSDEYPTRAHRPRYSVLDTTKIRETFNLTIPTWQESLQRFLQTL